MFRRLFHLCSRRILGGCFVLVFGFLSWAVVPTLSAHPLAASTRVLARDGSLLYEVNSGDAEQSAPVPLSAMPPLLVSSVLAAEDKHFYTHHGVDWLGLGRALKDNIRAGAVVSGGSTIEQQLIKNLYYSDRSRTVLQKARELVAARWWTVTHKKDETLERYLNTVYLGNNIFGMQTAARAYFQKDVTDLALPESALLAGIIGAPGRYEPIDHAPAAYARQRFVLAQLVEGETLTQSELEQTVSVPLSIFALRHKIRAPHFVFRVLDELEKTIPDIRTGGYTVTTTLDSNLQTIAEDSVWHQLFKLSKKHVSDAAAVAVDPRTGEVLAYVGSADYWDESIAGRVNMANAKRQPGSALKPFMYLTALMKGQITPASVVADLPVRFETQPGNGEDPGSYFPRNYNLRYNGPVSVRDALGSSLNIPAVKVLDQLGLNTFFDTLSRFELTFPKPPEYYGLGIVLGGGEVTLEEVTQAFASLARLNQSIPLVFASKVEDRAGHRVFASQMPKLQPIFDASDHVRSQQAAVLLSDILSDHTARARSFGETSLLEIGKPVAAKTGTTKDFRDNWAFGYTPDFVLGVWAGNADNTPMDGVSGISGAVPIWHDVMAARFRYEDPASFPAVQGMIKRDVCVTSGLLATPLCPKTRTELFIEGTEPTQSDTWYRSFVIDARTGLIATSRCQIQTLTKTYLVPPSEYRAWAVSANIEQPPTRDCEGHAFADGQAASGSFTILAPLEGDVIELDTQVEVDMQRVPFVASHSCSEGCQWTLNGEHWTSTESSFLWHPKPGTYTLDLDGADRQVHFTVK